MKLLKKIDIDTEKWNACIASSDNPLIYGLIAYLDIVAKDWQGLVWEDNDEYVAVFPLPIRVRYGLKYVYPPFFIQQLGLFTRGNNRDELEKEAFDFLNGKINFIELYVKGRGILGTKRRNCTLLLNNSYDSLRLNYSSNHKRNLKKAQKANLTVECRVNISEIVNLFRLDKGAHLDTLQNQDYKNLQNIAIEIESECYGVYSDGKLICGGLFLKFKGRITFLFSGNSEEGKNKGALFFLLDHLISINANKQIIFDFEGSENDGLRRFYLGFGGELEIYRFIRVNKLKFPFSLFKK
jgi:hypothetical protein